MQNDVQQSLREGDESAGAKRKHGETEVSKSSKFKL
jgi:hypothetical protein